MATAWPPSCSLDPDALRRLITRPYSGAWPRTAVWRGQLGRASLLNVTLSASPQVPDHKLSAKYPRFQPVAENGNPAERNCTSNRLIVLNRAV